MGADPLLILLILVFGCAAFFLGLLYLIGRVFTTAGRGFRRLVGGRARGANGAQHYCGTRPLACPRASCRNVEHRPATFCSRCGARLGESEQGPHS